MFKSRDAGRSGHRGVLCAGGHQQRRGRGVRRALVFPVEKDDRVAARDGPFAVAAWSRSSASGSHWGTANVPVPAHEVVSTERRRAVRVRV